MEQSEFEAQVKRLETRFGKVNPVNLKAIWQAVKYKSAGWLELKCNAFIFERRTWPIPKDFLEDSAPAARAKPVHVELELTDCRHCSGGGYVSVTRTENNYTFSQLVRCSCERGGRVPQEIGGISIGRLSQ